MAQFWADEVYQKYSDLSESIVQFQNEKYFIKLSLLVKENLIKFKAQVFWLIEAY